VLDGDGNIRRSWDIPLADGHGITLVKEGGSEYLWFADPGRKRDPDDGYENRYGDRGGQVVKATLDGEVTMSLAPPDIPVYRDGSYLPTSVAVHEERHGGNGDIWVADGYGESHVHRFDRSGAYLSSINGTEGGAGAFDCPHARYSSTTGAESRSCTSPTGATLESRSTTWRAASRGPSAPTSSAAPAPSSPTATSSSWASCGPGSRCSTRTMDW